MLAILAFAIFSARCASALWTIDMFYSNDTTCVNPITSFLVTETPTCTSNLFCGNLNNLLGTKRNCWPSFQDSQLTGMSILKVWTVSQTCSGTQNYLLAAEPGKCSGFTTSYTYLLNCATSTIYACSSSATCATGCTPISAPNTGACAVAPQGAGFASYRWSCSSSQVPTTTAPASAAKLKSVIFGFTLILAALVV